MKLCKDCRWYRTDTLLGTQEEYRILLTGYCQHQRAVWFDYVGGHHKQYPAAAQRGGKGELFCGPEAKDFEPKEGAPNEPAS